MTFVAPRLDAIEAAPAVLTASESSGASLTSATYISVFTLNFTVGTWLLNGYLRIGNSITTASGLTAFILLTNPGDGSTAGNTIGNTQIRFNWKVSTDFMVPISGVVVVCDGVNMTVAGDSVTGTTLDIKVFVGTFTVGTASAEGRVTAIKTGV